MVLFVDNLSNSQDKGSQLGCIYTDFAKAFDSVSHSILIDKLKSYGIYRKLLDWFRSYLINKEINVVIARYQSHTFVATSGVPKGSRLGFI